MKTKKNFYKKLVNIHTLKWIILSVFLVTTTFKSTAQSWSLQQCVDTALVYNKNLQISRNNATIGAEKAEEAKAGLIPKVNIGADYKYFFDLPYQLMPMTTFNPAAPEGDFKEIQFGVPHNINANIQLTMPLYNPQIYGAIQTTKIAAELSELQYKKASEQVYFEISNLFYNAQILMHQQDFIDSNLVNTSRLLENLQLLHSQQMIKKSDVTKVELQKSQLLTQQDMAANSYEQVINALKFLMGIPATQHIQIEKQIGNQNIQDYHNQQHVDLQLASTQNRFIASELSTLRNARLPSVAILGSYSQTGFGYDKKPDEFLKFFPVSFAGIQVSYPLFNGTVTNRKIKQKKIEVQNSELQVALVKDQNEMLIENAIQRRFIARQIIGNTSGQIILATTVYEQMLLQQKEGTASLTEVLLADNALREAQQAYLTTIVDYLKADLELKKLTGNILINN
jgi:OMF family outer membrane factor